MRDYADAYSTFDLGTARAVLSAGGENGLNAAVECCDRWCGAGRTGLVCADEAGNETRLSFEDLKEASSRLANLLASLGVAAGDRVAGLLPRTPELLVTILAVWRLGGIYQPLFTAFGPKAIEHRVATSGARVVVTDAGNRDKLSDVAADVRIIVTDEAARRIDTDIVMNMALAEQPAEFAPVTRSLEDPFLMMFTSGTTGAAKPLLVPLKAIAAFVGYMRDAIDLRPEDRFWNIADPGWAYGLYYGITGPLAMGQTVYLYKGGFSAESSVAFIKKYGITNLAGSPTAFRLIVAAGPEAVAPIAGQLRAVSSAGEALNPEVVHWFARHLKAPIYDHYGQTELGMVVCNHHALKHKVTPGSAGFAVPGHRIVVIDEQGNELPPHQPGELAVDIEKSPLYWFRGYENGGQRPTRYYRSGDIVELNDDGSISFVGRADDVITSSGYRIGPFEVESALIEHDAVVEAAVVGKPDPQRTEIVKAFIILKPGVKGDDDLVRELQEHVKKRLSAHSYPREIAFVESLPKTPSGKIQRFILRAQEKAAAAAC